MLIPVRQDEDVFMKDKGLLHEVAVTGRKVGTPDELRQFFSALAHDERKFREVMDEVLGRAGLTESERMAANILGFDKVAGYFATSQAWKDRMVEAIPTMPFSEETLRHCAEENEKGADWRVVYILGRSLREQKKTMGTNRKKQPCFDSNSTWWLEPAQDVWANQSVAAGYRLFDFSGRFSNMQWQTQEDEIKKLGDCYERAEEQAVAEACLTIYMVSGKKERLLTNWYHWGRLLAAGSSRVHVGRFGGNGFRVNNCWGDHPDDVLRVVLSRKF